MKIIENKISESKGDTMREIGNKNINNLNFTGIQKASNDGTVTPEVQAAPVESKEIKDLTNMPAASLGKSQVLTDSVESDMNILLKNPTQVAQLNMIFDKYQENHSYEEATQLLDAYRNEFKITK